MTDRPVLITGAGPTGLVLAIWLARLGIPLRIIDRKDGPAPFSRALGVHARTLELYRQLGFADAIVEYGVQVRGVNLWVGGRRAARVPFDTLGTGLTPYPFILDFAQDEHERFLVDRLSAMGVEVEWQTTLVGFEQHVGGVRATLRHADATEEHMDVAYLAGCDGVHSTVRARLGADFAGGTYSRLFCVADVDATGDAVNDEIHVGLDDVELLAVFAMRGTGRIRLVCTIHDEQAPSPAALTFDHVSRRVIEGMGLTVQHVHWFSTYRVHH
nr:FAD-dependent monooxygenase [Gemmatimonadaceae bacterium]